MDMVKARMRTAAAALALAGVVALGGCTSTFTAQPYTPGIGTNVDAGPVKVRALVLVLDGESAQLTGSIVGLEADTLLGITGHAQDAAFDNLGALSFPDTRIAIAKDKLTPLTDKNLVTQAGDLTLGLTAEITFNFENSGSATVQVPVVDASHADYTPTADSEG
ncbi:hypothetical protein ACPCG0_04350 [Propionibacteriaceae bacterium Y1923]|uniref:hypothetical protein n=1 Tax=Aestuariimicrobium sp. Y1814 TaxID=3418742 RepID=UPI003C1C8330